MQRPQPPANDEDLCFRPAGEVAGMIRSRTLSPVEVLEAVARRIEAWNPKINAYCTIDLDRARKDAHIAEQVVMHRGELGPLHGVPVAVKDDLAVKGMRYTAGSRLMADHVADYDDEVVVRLRRAGAVIVGKTNLPEFGHKGTTENLLFGATANPWNPGRSAGGSSGVRAPRSRRAWPTWRWEPTLRVRSRSPRASAVSWATNPRWAGYRAYRRATPSTPPGRSAR